LFLFQYICLYAIEVLLTTAREFVKQKITSELVPHEMKDIIEDIHKLLQAIHKIVGHIEQDSVLTKDVLTKTSTDIQTF